MAHNDVQSSFKPIRNNRERYGFLNFKIFTSMKSSFLEDKDLVVYALNANFEQQVMIFFPLYWTRFWTFIKGQKYFLKNQKNLCSRIFERGTRFEGKGHKTESSKDFEILLRCRSAKKSRLCDPDSNTQVPVNKMYRIAPSENTVSPSEEYWRWEYHSGGKWRLKLKENTLTGVNNLTSLNIFKVVIR